MPSLVALLNVYAWSDAKHLTSAVKFRILVLISTAVILHGITKHTVSEQNWQYQSLAQITPPTVGWEHAMHTSKCNTAECVRTQQNPPAQTKHDCNAGRKGSTTE